MIVTPQKLQYLKLFLKQRNGGCTYSNFTSEILKLTFDQKKGSPYEWVPNAMDKDAFFLIKELGLKVLQYGEGKMFVYRPISPAQKRQLDRQVKKALGIR